MRPGIESYLQRVAAVELRLGASGRPLVGLTAPDGRDGERWEAAQVWGHITEFVPYWIEQIEEVLDDPGRGPLGRTRSDPDRLAGIESGRTMPFEVHLHWLAQHLAELRGFLGALTDEDWEKEGVHPTLGGMSLDRMIEEFLVGHLEQHATQLETLATG
jgi:hypothetical protein